MGWLRTILLADIGNRLDIGDAEDNIHKLQRSNHNKDATISVLHDELEKQKLGLQALTRFLLEKKLIAEDELAQFIDKVDAEDGIVDGKMRINLPVSNHQSQPAKHIPNVSDVAGTPWEKDSGYEG